MRFRTSFVEVISAGVIPAEATAVEEACFIELSSCAICCGVCDFCDAFATEGGFAELFSIGSVSVGGAAATVEDDGDPAAACGVPASACGVPATACCPAACGVPAVSAAACGVPAAGFVVEVEDEDVDASVVVPVFLCYCASFKNDLYMPLV